MPAYRLYHLKNGRFFHFDAIDASDDAAAAAEAETLLGGEAAELWAGSRLVRAYGAEDGPFGRRHPAAA